jgi:hypothetical protein
MVVEVRFNTSVFWITLDVVTATEYRKFPAEEASQILRWVIVSVVGADKEAIVHEGVPVEALDPDAAAAQEIEALVVC